MVGATEGQPTHHDAFICHSSEDKTIADAIVANLEASGVRCWIAPRDVVPGESYVEDIVVAIEASRLVIFVFSSNSNESPHVSRELGVAVNAGIPILPFRVEDIVPSPTLEFYISGAHWLDAMTPPLQAHLGRLALTARVLLGFDSAQVPQAPAAAAPAGGFIAERWPWLVALGALLVVALVVGVVAVLGGGDAKDPEAAPPDTTAPVFTAPDPSIPEDTAPGDSAAPDGDTVSILDLEPGDCYDDSALDTGTGDIALSACDTPHDNEVFAVFDLADGPDVAFPGDQTVQSDATEGCEGQRFTAYVGVASASSRFVVWLIPPSQESWELDDDREVVCLLYDPDFEPLTESAEGSSE